MKEQIALFILTIICVSCATSPTEESQSKMVPDRTPYIAGLIEASNDTLHHYPEVVVGYVTDSQNFDDPNILKSYPEIYSPTLHRQLVQTSVLFSLGFQPEPEAKVVVRGPIGTSKEKEVTFTHEGNGIYGDQEYELFRVAKGHYELHVELPSGNNYSAKTHIPEAVNITLPDSISIPVKYEPFADGTPRETFLKPYLITFQNPEDSYMRVLQYNSSLDRELLLLEPDEEFRFTERSNYLRTGIGYDINLTKNEQDTLIRRWSQNLDKPRNNVWMKNHWWLRFSFFDKGIGKMFFPLVDFFSTKQGWLDQIHEPTANAATQNDSTYLFDVSTIRKLSADGRMLPKDSSDAIGFFSGYYSTYRQTTLYPIRNFDLDSVLTSTEAN